MSDQIDSAAKVSLWTRSFLFIMAANGLLFMAFEMLLPTLPLFVSSIGGEASQIGLITGIFTVSAILVRPFSGILTTRFNKKYLLIFGMAICALSTGLYYLASDVWMLLVIRLIHGIGFGLATIYITTIAAENMPKERMGEAMGYFGVGETIAISLGPVIGVSLLQSFNFNGMFWSAMAISLLAILFACYTSRKSEFSNENGTENHTPSKFKWVEKRVLLPSILIFMTGIAAGGVMSFTALYAVEKGFHLVAWFFFLSAASGLVVRVISGKMFDRYGPGAVLIPSGLITIAGFIVLLLAHNEPQFLIAGFLYGSGFGAIFPALQTWCLNMVEIYERENSIASFFNFFDFGLGGGSLILGIVAEAFSYQSVYFVAIIAYLLFLLIYIIYTASKNRQISAAKNQKVSLFR
ncbi:MFS transporter [Neobacillus drentensis]|uniref:MFS transporter n=1 Tax=Neobacillus drentensis TaxID=220684 RepID=UPI001F26A92E|nr:MFS transporter [Neobacillus drentensis]ULT57892.1 MFS transporter [Neobacillus drentensis]